MYTLRLECTSELIYCHSFSFIDDSDIADDEDDEIEVLVIATKFTGC